MCALLQGPRPDFLVSKTDDFSSSKFVVYHERFVIKMMSSSSVTTAAAKLALAIVFCGLTVYSLVRNSHDAVRDEAAMITTTKSSSSHRRLLEATTSSSQNNNYFYMKDLFADLDARKKLFEETPEEEVKYWFEYSGPLPVKRV